MLTTRVFEGWELDTTADEPRVRDVDLAVRAGFERPRKVRELIERNRVELENHGPLHVRPTVERTSMPRGGERAVEVREFWLTEPQAVNLVALMRTERAVELRVSLVRLFVAWRKGQAAPMPALPLDVASGPRVGEHLVLRREVERQCLLAARACGRTLHAVHGAIRRTFRVSGIYQLPALAWPSAKMVLEAVALGELELPSRPRGKLRLVAPNNVRQLALPLEPQPGGAS